MKILLLSLLRTSQPKKWERYVKIYAENSEKQIIERFKRSKDNESFECDAAWIYGQRNQVLSIFWKPETSLNETTDAV